MFLSLCISWSHTSLLLPIILISLPTRTKHFSWRPDPSNQEKRPLTQHTLTCSSADPLCLFKHSWQPEDGALEIEHGLIYSIALLPCRLVTCRPWDAIVSYQTSDTTAEVHSLALKGAAVKTLNDCIEVMLIWIYILTTVHHSVRALEGPAVDPTVSASFCESCSWWTNGLTCCRDWHFCTLFLKVWPKSL